MAEINRLPLRFTAAAAQIPQPLDLPGQSRSLRKIIEREQDPMLLAMASGLGALRGGSDRLGRGGL